MLIRAILLDRSIFIFVGVNLQKLDAIIVSVLLCYARTENIHL